MTLDEIRADATVVHSNGFLRFELGLLMSVALEDAEFLYAFVRVTKPLAVVECGTGNGVSAAFMADALLANGQGGYLTTYEHLPEYAARAADLIGLERPVEIVAERCPGWAEGDATDLVFIDSGVAFREEEMRHWLTCGYRGLVVIHDAMREYPEFALGEGVSLLGGDGFWVGRGK